MEPSKPDTTEAVAKALLEIGTPGELARRVAETAIKAHNKKLAELVPEREDFNDLPEFWLRNSKARYNEGGNAMRRLFLGDEA